MWFYPVKNHHFLFCATILSFFVNYSSKVRCTTSISSMPDAFSMPWIRTFNIICQYSENLFSFSWFNFLNWRMCHFASNIVFVFLKTSHNYCYSCKLTSATSCWITFKTIPKNHPFNCITSLASTMGQWVHLPRIPFSALYGSISDSLRGLAPCQNAFSVLICCSYLKCSLFSNLFRWCDSV